MTETGLVTDNGPQMISKAFQNFVSLDTNPFVWVPTAYRHPETIGCIERWHGSLEYEEILANEYEDPIEAKRSIERYREFYNRERIHQALNYRTPYEAVLQEVARQKGMWTAPEMSKNLNFSDLIFCSKNG